MNAMYSYNNKFAKLQCELHLSPAYMHWVPVNRPAKPTGMRVFLAVCRPPHDGGRGLKLNISDLRRNIKNVALRMMEGVD